MIKKSTFILLLFLAYFTSYSQTNEEKKKITSNYNIDNLEKIEKEFEKGFSVKKNEALILANKNNWLTKYIDSDGSFNELIMVTDEGKPIYYKTDNVAAARSTRANYLHDAGGLNLNIEGQGMTAYVWDGGLARSTHQEYDGSGGFINRYSIGDGTTSLNFHGAHVTGTIISSGVDPRAKGMAPKAKAVGHDWNSDLSEATNAAANGMLLSNHSYGFGAENIPDFWFGAYIQQSREWDELMYNAPYYLMIVSAGNDGNDNSSNASPLAGNPAFDKLSGNKTSKNSLVIANGQDADINGDGSLNSVAVNSSSSEGPTDDLRVKPDIMGNGTGVFSTYESNNSDYATISGTSMASPNVAGTLLLLQQYYNETNGTFMRASTLKGLALHTADDVSLTGPDARTGWGLLNAKKAAETITIDGLQSQISELVLNQGETYVITVKALETEDLKASISWTDLPGQLSTSVNSPTPILVNDLDIRVSNTSNTFTPWKLLTIDTAIKDDNSVDPYERVDVENPSGEYTITVSHKGNLSGGPQRFSLVLTGISSDFKIQPKNAEKTVCNESSISYDFDYRQIVAGTTNFSINNLPVNASSSFSQNSLNADGSFTLTISNLDDVAAGDYEIEVVGNNGNETESRIITLKNLKSDFSNNSQVLALPSNGERGVSFSRASLKAQKNDNAESYFFEFSDNPSFNNIIVSGETTATEFFVSDLESEKVYYWRVKPKNRCGEGVFSEVFTFQTGINDCSKTFTGTDFSDSEIVSFSGDTTASIPIEVDEDLTVNRVLVSTSISHTDVADLSLYLQEPTETGGNGVILISNACDENDDFSNVTFDDTGNTLICGTTTPAITGVIKPQESLGRFGGKNARGTWVFFANDNALFGGGQIDAVSITICTSEANTLKPNFVNNEITIAANGIDVITATDIEATSTSENASQQVYTITRAPQKGTLQKEGVDLLLGSTFTQDDINLGKISFKNSQTSLFTDEFDVNILNNANGWLSNQRVSMRATTLSIDSLIFSELNIYPNPANSEINISLNLQENKQVKISLYDLRGRRIIDVNQVPTNNKVEKQINVDNISSGIYLLKISQGQKSFTKKIIINK